MQDMRSDSPIKAAGSEGKLKQGVSSNCPYPVQGTGLGNAKQRQEERRLGHLGTNPPSPRDAAPIQDPGLTPASLLALLFFFILHPGVTICPGFQGAWRGGSGGRCARGGCGVVGGLCCMLGPGSTRGGGETGRARPIIPSVNPRLNYKRIIHVQPWPHL